MDTATITKSMVTFSLPQYVIVNYEYDMGADSTALVAIELPALSTSEPSYRQELRKLLTGKAYVIDLIDIRGSCGSTNFDVIVFNEGSEPPLFDTVYEVGSELAINKHRSFISTRLIVRNQDSIPINKLYLYLVNNDGVNNMGIVKVQLTYITLQDREPV